MGCLLEAEGGRGFPAKSCVHSSCIVVVFPGLKSGGVVKMMAQTVVNGLPEDVRRMCEEWLSLDKVSYQGTPSRAAPPKFSTLI